MQKGTELHTHVRNNAEIPTRTARPPAEQPLPSPAASPLSTTKSITIPHLCYKTLHSTVNTQELYKEQMT